MNSHHKLKIRDIHCVIDLPFECPLCRRNSIEVAIASEKRCDEGGISFTYFTCSVCGYLFEEKYEEGGCEDENGDVCIKRVYEYDILCDGCGRNVQGKLIDKGSGLCQDCLSNTKKGKINTKSIKDSTIKFRVWDPINRKMYYNIAVGKFNCFKIGDVRVPFSNKPIMQYTNLHDFRGKEIYDGDILKLEYSVRSEIGSEIKISNYKEVEEVQWGGYCDGEYVSNVECWMFGSESLSELIYRIKTGDFLASCEDKLVSINLEIIGNRFNINPEVISDISAHVGEDIKKDKKASPCITNHNSNTTWPIF